MTTTWNPSDKDAGITLSGSDLIATGSAGQTFRTLRATTAITTGGKRFWQVKFTTVGGAALSAGGFANSAENLASWLGNSDVSTRSVGNYNGDATMYGFGTIGTMSLTWAVNDVLTYCVDFDNKLMWEGIGAGTVWNAGGTADPATGTGGFTFTATGDVFPAATLNGSAVVVLTTTDVGLARAIPSGYSVFDPSSDVLMAQAVM